MGNYKIKENEVIRSQNTIALKTVKGDIPAEIILTTMNFIFVTEGKKFLWFKPKAKVKVFAKELVKTYKEAPEIKQTGTEVRISFAKEDRILQFETKKDARNFVINAWEIITGKGAFERNLDKLKQALDLIDEKLDLNLMQLAKETISNGVASAKQGILQAAMNKFLKK